MHVLGLSLMSYNTVGLLRYLLNNFIAILLIKIILCYIALIGLIVEMVTEGEEETKRILTVPEIDITDLM